MRRTVLAIAVALVVAACGGSGDGAVDVSSAAPVDESTVPAPSDAAASGDSDTEAPSETEAPAETTDEGTEAAASSFDGPPAPDFQITLADGTAFSLSAEQKPVYMVFWAEW